MREDGELFCSAGLCRTCEVFAVDTLVLGNTRILDDRMFQSLSVTAEKWLHILEVQYLSFIVASVVSTCLPVVSHACIRNGYCLMK